MIIDTHCHIGKFGEQSLQGTLKEPFKGREITNKEQLFSRVKADKIIVVPTYTPKPEQAFEYNTLVTEVIDNQKTFGGVWVNPFSEQNDLTLFSKPGVKAVKISPSAWNKHSLDPSTWPEKIKEKMSEIVSEANKNNLVIQTHTGGGGADVKYIHSFIEEYDVPLQLVHMGNAPKGHFKLSNYFFDWVETGVKVYADIAWAVPFAVKWFAEETNGENLLFASDEPWGDYASTVTLVKQLPEDIQEKVFHFNAEKLYGF